MTSSHRIINILSTTLLIFPIMSHAITGSLTCSEPTLIGSSILPANAGTPFPSGVGSGNAYCATVVNCDAYQPLTIEISAIGAVGRVPLGNIRIDVYLDSTQFLETLTTNDQGIAITTKVTGRMIAPLFDQINTLSYKLYPPSGGYHILAAGNNVQMKVSETHFNATSTSIITGFAKGSAKTFEVFYSTEGLGYNVENEKKQSFAKITTWQDSAFNNLEYFYNLTSTDANRFHSVWVDNDFLDGTWKSSYGNTVISTEIKDKYTLGTFSSSVELLVECQ